MPNLYSIVARKEPESVGLSSGEISSIFYHDIFDYPLDVSDLVKWKASDKVEVSAEFQIQQKNGYLFLEGREGLIYKRLLRKRISDKKFEIAKQASRIISLIPSIKLVAVTGSLAMGNSAEGSDIDLLIVTKNGTLWQTRALTYLLLFLTGIRIRQPGRHNEKDRLCLNIWLDERDLGWKKSDKNVYSAHEIGQIRPLVNKNKTYEKLLAENKWILNYWPNSVKITKEQKNQKTKERFLISSVLNFFSSVVEKFAFWLQYQYMRGKITRELVTPTRALFHPQDWGKIVLSRL